LGAADLPTGLATGLAGLGAGRDIGGLGLVCGLIPGLVTDGLPGIEGLVIGPGIDGRIVGLVPGFVGRVAGTDGLVPGRCTEGRVLGLVFGFDGRVVGLVVGVVGLATGRVPGLSPGRTFGRPGFCTGL